MLCAAIPMGGLLGWRCLHFADTGVLALLHLLAGAPISITCDTVGNGSTASGPALMEPHPLMFRCKVDLAGGDAEGTMRQKLRTLFESKIRKASSTLQELRAG